MDWLLLHSTGSPHGDNVLMFVVLGGTLVAFAFLVWRRQRGEGDQPRRVAPRRMRRKP